MVYVESFSIPLRNLELEAYLVVFGNAWVSLSSRYNFLHDFSITVHIYDCGPGVDPNYIHLYLDPFLYVVLLVNLQMLQLKNCSLPSLHAGD
jgi:hypothetical protein